VYNDTYTLNII